MSDANLITGWYAALGFADPDAEWDPESETYKTPEAETE